jgi:small-conductance mechanosensitive channel
METQISKILFDPTIGKIVTITILSIIIIAISRFIKSRSANLVKNIDVRYRIRKMITLVTYLLIVLTVSIVYSDKLGGLTVALGVAGAGIAFALQEVIASVAGWLAISFSNFYKVGDRVELGGSIGDVVDIGILRTTIMECREWVQGDQYTGRIVRIANSFVFKDSVFNYSGDFSFLWDEIKLPIRYGSDIILARDIFNRAAQEITSIYIPAATEQWEKMKAKFRIEDASVEPLIFMVANDNWLEFSLRYVVDFRERRSTQNKLFTFILNEINNTNGKVQFASATFELVALPSINVKTND